MHWYRNGEDNRASLLIFIYWYPLCQSRCSNASSRLRGVWINLRAIFYFKVSSLGMQCRASPVGWPWLLFAKPARWVHESNIATLLPVIVLLLKLAYRMLNLLLILNSEGKKTGMFKRQRGTQGSRISAYIKLMCVVLQFYVTYDLYIAAFAGAGITLLALVSDCRGDLNHTFTI